jgi:hypothetical protein
MMRSMARRLGMVLALVAVPALTLAPGSNAVTAAPTLKMLTILHHADAFRCCGDPFLFIFPGIYVASVNGAFEIDATRGTDGKITLWQVSRDSSGAHRIKKINPPGAVSMFEGLPGFFHEVLTDSSGKTVSQSDTPFCPSGWFFGSSRADPTGPDNPTYPGFCGSDLTRATAWGLDKGWAVPLNVFLDGTNVPDGDYTLTIGIAATYVRQLGIASNQASGSTTLTVTTQPDCPPDFPCVKPQAASARGGGHGEGPQNLSKAEAKGNGGLTGSGTPNLEALPAFSFFAENNPDDGHDYLDFAATIWNGGTGPLVVEGFRSSDTPVMNAFQTIYNNGVPGTPTSVGQFEFDTRPGHEHWHLEDIAQYDLLDATGTRVVLSEKQSFCLAPTDPIDLLAAGANWQPDRAGLWSACAGQDSIWLREVLPAGWGDTYFQSLAGQSFDITNLPNGHYQLRVTTDPFHKLLETTYADNASVVGIDIGGTPGSRTVTAS